MANKFNFRLLTGENPQEQYNKIEPKEALTFYLLGTGIGYLGEVKLFDATETSTETSAENFKVITASGAFVPSVNKTYIVVVDGVSVEDTIIPQGVYYSNESAKLTNVTYNTIAKYIAEKAVTDMTTESYTGDNDTLATTKAIVDYVKSAVNNQTLLEAKFFNNVATVTLTAEDIAGQEEGENVAEYGDIFQGNKAGDIGLVFTLNGDGEDDIYTFVNLNSLMDVYGVESSDSITMSSSKAEDGSTKFKAELKVNDESIEVTSDGVALKKSESDLDKSLTSEVADENKLVTEKAMVAFVKSVLEDYVSFTIDDDK